MLTFFGKVDEPSEALGAAHEENGILGVHVGDEQCREKVSVGGSVFFKLLDKCRLLLLDVREADFLNLGNAEDLAAFFVFFAIRCDDVFARKGKERGSNRKNLRGQISGRNATDLGQAFHNLAIDIRRCGRGEIEGIGNKAAHEHAGDGFWNWDVRLTETIRDDRAGRSNRPIHEKYRLLSWSNADAVVIKNFNDRNFLCAAHGLREFVVVDQNQSSWHWLQEVAF